MGYSHHLASETASRCRHPPTQPHTQTHTSPPPPPHTNQTKTNPPPPPTTITVATTTNNHHHHHHHHHPPPPTTKKRSPLFLKGATYLRLAWAGLCMGWVAGATAAASSYLLRLVLWATHTHTHTHTHTYAHTHTHVLHCAHTCVRTHTQRLHIYRDIYVPPAPPAFRVGSAGPPTTTTPGRALLNEWHRQTSR